MPVGGGITLTVIQAPKLPGRVLPLGYGEAVVHGEWMAVSAYEEEDCRVYMYQRTGTAWKQQQKLSSSQALVGANREFGRGILQGNDLIVAAPEDDNFAGAAYYFHYSGTRWVEKQVIQASTKASDEGFADSSALHGDTAVFGVPGNPTAQVVDAAHVFVRSGTTWTQQQKLTCPLAACQGRALFSKHLALSGDTLLVGAHNSRPGGIKQAGAAYIFVRQGTTWKVQQELAPKGLKESDSFGSTVAVAGDTAVVGAHGDSTRGISAGAAYLFNRTGTTWTQTTKIVPGDLKKYYSFGSDIVLRGDLLLIGAPADPTRGEEVGSIYVFRRRAGRWIQQVKLVPPGGIKWFGRHISFDGKTLAVSGIERAFVGPWTPSPGDAGPTGDTGPPAMDGGEQGCSCALGKATEGKLPALLLLLLATCLLMKIRQTSPS